MNHSTIIDLLGGPTRVAKLLGLSGKRGVVQRVSNWKKRGIPARVRLDHADVFSGAIKSASFERGPEALRASHLAKDAE